MFTETGDFDETAHIRVAESLIEFVRRAPNIVMVSDYIYSDAELYPPMVEAYREGLAYIDKALARRCDHVIEVVNGTIIMHKGDIKCFGI